MTDIIKTLIIDVQSPDVQKRVDAIVQLTKEIDKLTEEQRQNKQQTDAERRAYAENAQQMKLLKQEVRDNERDLNNYVRSQRLATGSVKQMQASVAVLSREYYKMSEAERVSTERGRQLAAQINQLNASINRTKMAVGDSTSNIGKYFQSFGNRIAGSFRRLGGMIASYLSIQAISSFVKKSIESARAQEQAFAKLSAVLKSTGGAAGFSAKELSNMASELQSVTTFGDEAILNAQAILATFTKVGRETFPQATEAILNLSATLDTDLKSSAVMIGKALNDPIKGVTALRRAGVQLTAQQQDQVKAFVKAGDTLSAQKIILGELETQMGGVARAIALTDTGKIKQLGNVFDDLREAIGARFQKVLASTTGFFGSLIKRAQEFVEIKMSDTLKDQYRNVNALVSALGDQNIAEEQRKKLYEELKLLAPEIVEGIDLENASTVTLSKNLNEFNKQQVKRIALAMAYEKQQEAMNAQAEREMGYAESRVDFIIQTNNIINKLTGNQRALAEQSRDLFEGGSQTISDYYLSINRLAEAEGGLRTERGIMSAQFKFLIQAQKDQMEGADEAANAMDYYKQAADALNVSLGEVVEYTTNLTKRTQGLGDETYQTEEELKKLEKEAKKAEEALIKLKQQELEAANNFIKMQKPLEELPYQMRNLKAELDRLATAATGEDINKELQFITELENRRAELERRFYQLRVETSKEGTQEKIDAELALEDIRYKEEQEKYKENKSVLELLEKEHQQNVEKIKTEGVKTWIELHQKEIDYVINGLSTIANALGQYYDYKNAKEKASLDAFEKTQETERRELQRKLDANTISRAAYDREIARLDEAADRKRRQNERAAAKRAKTMAIINATIQGTQATLAAYAGGAQAGGPAALATGAIFAAVAAAFAALQIGLIAAQPLPSAKRGRMVRGVSHSAGGEIIEAEYGEAVMNKKATNAFLPFLDLFQRTTGGVPFVNDNGYMAAQAAGKMAGTGGITASDLQGMKIYVTVEDINRVGKKVDVVTKRAAI